MAKTRPIYRILEDLWNLSTNRRIPMGALDQMKDASQKDIQKMIDLGRISEVKPPPLSILPGWTSRAAKLAEVGIKDVSQLASADIGQVAEELDVSEEGLQESVADALRWIYQ